MMCDGEGTAHVEHVCVELLHFIDCQAAPGSGAETEAVLSSPTVQAVSQGVGPWGDVGWRGVVVSER